MHVYLTNRDLLNVRHMVLKLLTLDEVDGITICDCGSSYPPLLKWYKEVQSLRQRVEVLYLVNLGPRAPFGYLRHCGNEPYCVSDADLDLSEFPQNALTILRERLEECPELVKVGASLRRTDLPLTAIGQKACRHERQFWTHPASKEGFFTADIDTTLAVYNRPTWGAYGPSERCGLVVARHLAWYLDHGNLPEDWKHYLTNMDRKAGATWSVGLSQQLEEARCDT